MFLNKKSKIIISMIGLLSFSMLSFTYGKAEYLVTNRDTKMSPEKVSYDLEVLDEYEKIHETDTLTYYFREDRDVIAIEDKRNGYTWKTGIDIPFGQEISQAVMNASKEEALEMAIPLEDGMNTTYTAMSNSILTVEYNEEGTTKYVSSGGKDLVESQLVTLNDNPATRRLDVNFQNIELKVKVHINFLDDSISYEIRDEDITGKGRAVLTAVYLTPFLGASGGRTKYYNEETGMYDIIENKTMIPGYIFVPDGSGSLIRFQDNTSSFSMYFGDVYGPDPAQNTYYRETLFDALPLKNPVMPVFGIAHGDGQAAFVAYAEDGDEYMQIAVRPEENMTAYHYVYPRFVYNVNYYQVYNNKGDGFFTMMEEPNHMNISMKYTFLSGDGSDGTPAADYTGMATTYRQHLIDQGILKVMEKEEGLDIPLRLDFILSDSKKGIAGTEEVVTTRVEDIETIMNQLLENSEIRNINSGLYGWQQGGETIAKPSSKNYYGKIGRESAFKKLFTEFAEKGIDISYARDYITINREMLSYFDNAARHVNSWYLELDKSYILPDTVPIGLFGYATPFRSARWLQGQADRMSSYSSSMTVDGISNVLVSNYNRNGIDITVTEAIELYQNTMEEMNQKVKLNLVKPNQYLWKYTDRFLQSPVGNSQYVFETDTVPFLQMVLHDTMEVYGPYCNFSFYTKQDILRMIDYNISPSFILSKESSHLLADTTSSDFYSTEFIYYEELINEIYGEVNAVLKQVNGFDWSGRRVIRDGVILNSYQKNNETKRVLINYTSEDVVYEEIKVGPLSAIVLSMEEVKE